jgi:hypothetical protein
MSIQPLDADEPEIYMMRYAGPILIIIEYQVKTQRRADAGRNEKTV